MLLATLLLKLVMNMNHSRLVYKIMKFVLRKLLVKMSTIWSRVGTCVVTPWLL